MWALPPGTDTDSWEDWYWNQHVPLARQMPGQTHYTTTLIERTAFGPTRYRMAEQYFPNLETLEASVASPIGQEVANDATGYVADLGLYASIEQEVELG
jgi:uncharacterized protein (TIGR02118 family)